MNSKILKLIILLAFTIFDFPPIICQETGSDFEENYDIRKLIQNAAESKNISESLKLLSEEDLELFHEIERVLSQSIQPILLKLLSDTDSKKCNRDLKYAQESYFTSWGMRMLDSYGKPESGVLMGNIRWLGNYDECLDVQAPPKENSDIGNFRGRYCSLNIVLKLGYAPLPISTAVCLPDSCQPNGTVLRDVNMGGSLSGLDTRMGALFKDATLSCKATSRKVTAGAVFTIFLLSIFVFLSLIASCITTFEYFFGVENASQDASEGVINKKRVLPAWVINSKPFLNCFCLFTNGEKLLDTTRAEGQLPCLHGLRFMSLCWVILGHSYGLASAFSKNGVQALSTSDHWTFQVVLNGYNAVDSFFVLSGFLVAYVYFKQADKTDGKISWLYFYVHRYIRLTPVYMIVLAFYAAVGPFLGSGPLWPDSTVVKACQDSWWWNVLYINNFLSMNTKGCMSWAWYLANDMQFYIISPLFLITLRRWPKIGYSAIGAFFCITFITNFTITYVYDLVVPSGNILVQPQQEQFEYSERYNDFLDLIYIKPYTRIGAYLVGLVLAYYLYKRKQNDQGKLNLLPLSVGWIVASVIALTCQFGLYHKPVLSLTAACFYNALARIGFSLGLAWVIFVCVIGQGGVVNCILSWRAWIPLSRLTYCAYLVHYIVQATYAFSLRTMLVFSHTNVIMLFLGFLVITYVAALLTSLLFESPMIRLERLIRNKFAS